MNRSAAATYLSNEYITLCTEVGFDTTIYSPIYSTAIDMALRQLGFAEADLATADVGQSDVLNYLALLNYYTLRRFARDLAIRVDVNIAGSVQAARSQAAKQVQVLLADAKAEVEALGFSISKPAMAAGRLTLDYLEPKQTEWTGGDSWWLY